MKKEKRTSKKGLCPFYKYETPSCVYCDSDHVQQGSAIHRAFARRDDFVAWKNDKCYLNYESCFIYNALKEFPI